MLKQSTSDTGAGGHTINVHATLNLSGIAPPAREATDDSSVPLVCSSSVRTASRRALKAPRVAIAQLPRRPRARTVDSCRTNQLLAATVHCGHTCSTMAMRGALSALLLLAVAAPAVQAQLRPATCSAGPAAAANALDWACSTEATDSGAYVVGTVCAANCDTEANPSFKGWVRALFLLACPPT